MKPHYLILLLCLMIVQGSLAQSSADIQAYIARYKQIALEEEKHGIPAPITLAQGILESGAGTSGLARNANNHFGIKRGYDWTGPCVYAWDDDPQKSPFRKYSSAEQSYRDHSKFLMGNGRYNFLFNKSVYDYRGWANGLQLAGYATSPTYAKALIGYIEAYRLYEINGGVKLKPGKTVTITKTITVEEIVEQDLQMEEDQETEEEESVTTAIRRTYVEINDVRCTILYPGETISSISMKYDIPKSKILAYNETTSEEDIHEGDIVYLEKKRKKFRGAQDYYKVKEGETLYWVSQQFGIRLSSLSKMNDLSLLSKLQPGTKLRLK